MNSHAVLEFIQAINDHDVEKIASLMTDDHTFIDAHGNQVVGKTDMKAGWNGYFHMFPDYRIELARIYEEENNVAAFGWAEGTYLNRKTQNNENHWRLPAAWMAVVSENKIKLWQVYADTKIPFEIIQRNK